MRHWLVGLIALVRQLSALGMVSRICGPLMVSLSNHQ
jgi:hypothetical protein